MYFLSLICLHVGQIAKSPVESLSVSEGRVSVHSEMCRYFSSFNCLHIGQITNSSTELFSASEVKVSETRGGL